MPKHQMANELNPKNSIWNDTGKNTTKPLNEIYFKKSVYFNSNFRKVCLKGSNLQ